MAGRRGRRKADLCFERQTGRAGTHHADHRHGKRQSRRHRGLQCAVRRARPLRQRRLAARQPVGQHQRRHRRHHRHERERERPVLPAQPGVRRPSAPKRPHQPLRRRHHRHPDQPHDGGLADRGLHQLRNGLRLPVALLGRHHRPVDEQRRHARALLQLRQSPDHLQGELGRRVGRHRGAAVSRRLRSGLQHPQLPEPRQPVRTERTERQRLRERQRRHPRQRHGLRRRRRKGSGVHDQCRGLRQRPGRRDLFGLHGLRHRRLFLDGRRGEYHGQPPGTTAHHQCDREHHAEHRPLPQLCADAQWLQLHRRHLRRPLCLRPDAARDGYLYPELLFGHARRQGPRDRLYAQRRLGYAERGKDRKQLLL